MAANRAHTASQNFGPKIWRRREEARGFVRAGWKLASRRILAVSCELSTLSTLINLLKSIILCAQGKREVFGGWRTNQITLAGDAFVSLCLCMLIHPPLNHRLFALWVRGWWNMDEFDDKRNNMAKCVRFDDSTQSGEWLYIIINSMNRDIEFLGSAF